MKRSALVSQPRVPEPDRDRGSERVDTLMRFLLDDGWSVTFLAADETPDPRHTRRLRQLGIPTFAGYANAPDIVAAGQFDLALLAFWQPASRLMPILREQSPKTRVLIDSIDVHFLREARRQLGVEGALDAQYGGRMAAELNAYEAADGVLAVSAKETDLLADFLGPGRAHHLALGEGGARSTRPFEERRGMLFVGNFRHLPNREAVEFLCRDILPRMDPHLLAEHPLTVAGSSFDEKIHALIAGMPHVNTVGWVPSVDPYVEHARVSVVPLLHGAGVKGKVVESMMTGTPVVTTRVGAEGLDIVDGEHALVADGPADLAAAITRLLVEPDTWRHIADAGAAHAGASQDLGPVRERFHQVVDGLLARPRPTRAGDGFGHGRTRLEAYQGMTSRVRDVVGTVTGPGDVVLVVSRGDDDLLAFDDRAGWHFPQGPDGGWAGYHPADSDAAVRHLEALRDRGATHLVLPDTAFWWLHHYEALAEHLDDRYRRAHADDHVIVFDLRAGAGESAALELEVPGTDWVVTVEANAVLPEGFVDAFLATADAIGAERAQPAHDAGPMAGPPVTERLRGCLGREVSEWLPIPVHARRAGAAPDGPVLLVDQTPIGLSGPIRTTRRAEVLDVFVAGADGPVRTVRGVRPPAPRISVLIATYDRPDLLAGCLEGFARQTVDRESFEIVVVDDGSPGDATAAVVDSFARRLPLVAARLDHAGRSAAKNLAVMLARADVVLFFDDDDRPAPDLLAEHLRAHALAPDEGAAVLGYTGWAPELTVTPLMRFLTDVDKVLFAYGNLSDGQQLDWRGFWEGRLSCKRSLLVDHGLHDQRLAYSIDVELGWRLARHGLRVVYCAAARSVMARSIDLDQFCARIEAKGRAAAGLASLHDDDGIRAYAKVDGAAERWAAARPTLASLAARARELEAGPLGPQRESELYGAYRELFAAYYAKGAAEALATPPAPPAPAPDAPGRVPARVFSAPRHRAAPPPALTVTIPVWSRTETLAAMAQRTVERVWEVSRLPTQVVVVDNGSPFPRALRADVFRYGTNRGVATAWNAGIELAEAPVVAVLNSDCLVEPGWDEALYEAVADGRRIAFPYTDHGDGVGFRRPDQGGTAGWCFMLSAEVYREVGPFDEQFSPAYGEDTDYWHRAWELGIELTPVPAARVTHARRTTSRSDPHVDLLLQAHRYKYAWKHGVDPNAAPPYYNRKIVEYFGR